MSFFWRGGSGIKNFCAHRAAVCSTERVHPHLQSSVFHFIKYFSSTPCLLRLLASVAARQNAGFGLSHTLKTKNRLIYVTLHVTSLALVLYQTQQMFKGKPNTKTHNTQNNSYYFWKTNCLQQRSNKKEYEHMPLYSVCLAYGLLNSFCSESHSYDGISISVIFYFFFVVIAYLIWTTTAVYCLHIGAIFSAPVFFSLRYWWRLYPI